MFTAECLLAAVLLSAPSVDREIDVAIPHGGILFKRTELDGWAEVLRPQILALGIAAEVLDPREKGFVMGQDPGGDLAMLRDRWTTYLAAPELQEAERFPDRALINQLLAVNRGCRNQLIERLAIDLVHAEEIRARIARVDQLYQVWDAVRDSRCDYYYVSVRRDSLRLLRDLVGPERFYSGRLPPPVP